MNKSDTYCVVKIQRTLALIQKVYLTFVCLFSLSILSLMVAIIDDPPVPDEKSENFFTFCILLLIYLGLRGRKQWVLPLILLNSTFLSFWELIRIFTPSSDFNGLIVKAVAVLLCLCNIYQIIFFTKTEVKSFFGVKGKIILGG